MTKRKCFVILTFILGMATAELSKHYTSTKFQPENTCGKRQISVIDKIISKEIPFQNIINGTKAELGYWPWIACLKIKYPNFVSKCGGTLISSQHVLTAAHCVDDKNIIINSSFVRLGDLDLDDNVDDKASPLDYIIQSITLHPKFDLTFAIYDIAIIKLQEIVSFTDLIQPICLPIESSIRDKNLTGKLLTVAGWGMTQSTQEIHVSNTALMEVEVPVWSTEKCKQVWSKTDFTIDEKVLCTGFENGVKNPCFGDSGGPLVLENGNQYFLMGIVSFGACENPGIPAAYTKVPFFLDWIFETAKKI